MAVKSRHGNGVIISIMPKEKYFPYELYKIKLNNPGYNHQARTQHQIGYLEPVHYEAGIIFLFESEFETLEFKQKELF